MIRPAASIDESAPANWLICRAGPLLCALALHDVAEIMRALPVEALPAAPACARGIAVVRGALVPVVDIGLLMGDSATLGGRWIAAKLGARTIALAVDEIVGIRAIDPAECTALPPLLRDAATEAIAGITARDAELIRLLSAARILPPEVLSRLDAERAA